MFFAQNPRETKLMGNPPRERDGLGRTPVKTLDLEAGHSSDGDVGALEHARAMNVHPLPSGGGDNSPFVAGDDVAHFISTILERMDVGRPFSFGEAVLDAGTPSISLHGPTLTLLAVSSGSLFVSGSGERRRRLDASHCALFLFDGELRFGHDSAVPASIAWCQTRIDAAPDSIAPGPTATPQVRISEQVRTLIRLGVDVRSTASAMSNERYRDAIGVAVISAFSAQIGGRAQLPAIVRKAREHADTHFSEDCDLSLLADVAGVTREHLTTAFRKHVGMTPVRYLWDVRARNAAHLVQSSDFNLSTIAERCGYKSPYHLSREIKRLTGVSPREIRRRDGSS